MRFGFRELAFVLLLLGLPVAAYFFVFQPRNAQITEAREEIRQKQSKLAQLEAATQSMPDIPLEIQKLTEAIGMFEQKLPAHHEIHGILDDVSKLAKSHHLQTASFRTEKTKSGAHYSEQPIRMKIRGNFDGLYAFLQAVEQLPRITSTTHLEVTRIKTQDSPEGTVEADMVLTIYYEGQQAAAPKTAAAGEARR
jgi:Tfp pilus assembly protein PilO